jgi:hypothetical protein
MITCVKWCGLTAAQVPVSNKTRAYPHGVLPAVVCCQAASPATFSIRRGHRN